MWDTSSVGPWMGETGYFFSTAKIKAKQTPNSLNFVTASKLLLHMLLLLLLGLFDLVAHSKSKLLAKLVVLWGWDGWPGAIYCNLDPPINLAMIHPSIRSKFLLIWTFAGFPEATCQIDPFPLGCTWWPVQQSTVMRQSICACDSMVGWQEATHLDRMQFTECQSFITSSCSY